MALDERRSKITIRVVVTLPPKYDSVFEHLLAEVAAAATEPALPIAQFWPYCGAAYEGQLMVIGRSVNGWITDRTAAELRDPAGRRAAVEELRADAEPLSGCRMSWVTDRWGTRDGYNTHRSAFWRVLRRIVLAGHPEGRDAARWSSELVWTNLYKMSPAAGWNPGADLQLAQRPSAIELLKIELATFVPRRVLALTGGWINPFREGLGLKLEPRPGLVEAIGSREGSAWVVAKHPMGKPEDRLVAEVMAAYEELGTPVRPRLVIDPDVSAS